MHTNHYLQISFLYFILSLSFLLPSSYCYGQSIKKMTSKNTAPPSEPIDLINIQNPSNIHKHILGVGIGQTFLYGDFQNTGSDQISADLIYSYTASYSFDFNANFHYSKHENQNQSTNLMGLALGIKGKAYQFDSFSPFLQGGLGIYLPTSTAEIAGKLLDSKSKLTLGYHIGLGADLLLNKNVVIGIMSQYHNPFDVKQNDGNKIEGSYLKVMMVCSYIFH